MPVTEVARIRSQEGSGDQFARRLEEAVDLFISDDGCHQMQVLRGVEEPELFVLLIEWTSVDAHLAFRDTPAYKKWRGLIDDLLGGKPEGSHFSLVAGKGSHP